MYDHPFQWGSKRTGPDLARIGTKYSDQWHQEHLKNPRAIVPDSIMPGYPFLATTELDTRHLADVIRTNKLVGVPYTDEDIANVDADVAAQVNPDDKNVKAFQARYPKAVSRDFSGDGKVTELTAVIAYLQMLGETMETYAAVSEFAQ
eukprot:gene21487-22363_t